MTDRRPSLTRVILPGGRAGRRARRYSRHARRPSAPRSRGDPRPRTDLVRRVHGARPLRAGRLLRAPAGRGRRATSSRARTSTRCSGRSSRARSRRSGRRWAHPLPSRIVEVGAGDGTLATAAARQRARRPRRTTTAIELSAGARSRARRRSTSVRIAAELTDGPHIVVAHELLDNLPFRRVRGDREDPRRAGRRTASWRCEVAWEGEPRPGRRRDVVPDGAFAFIDRLATALERGYALLIDYGERRLPGGRHPRLSRPPRGRGRLGRPRLERHHGRRGLRGDRRHAEERGLVAFPVVTQHHALRALGFEEWQRGELARQIALLDERDGLGAVRTWSGRSRATLLVDPVGARPVPVAAARIAGAPVPAVARRGARSALVRAGPLS